MAITPYGATLENNLPSPWEIYSDSRTNRARNEAIAGQGRMAKIKEMEAANKAYDEATKPLNQFKANTGYADPKPNLILNQQAQELQKKAAEMYKSGKDPKEIEIFIQNSVRDLDSQHNWYKDARESLDKQLQTIKSGDGIDVNKLRELAITDLLYVDDGKGGKRQRTAAEMEDVGGLLPKVMRKYAEAIPITDKAGLYNFKDDAAYGQDLKKVLTGDGRVVYGNASGNYNSLYQEVQQGKDFGVNVKTRAVDAEKNGEVITDKKGNTIKVLPTEAYLDFVSAPGRMIEVEKETRKRVKEERGQSEFEAMREAGNELSSMYGSKWREMPAAKRLSLQRNLQKQILETDGGPDEEIIRQKVAYELADKYVPKKGIKINEIRDPSIKITNNSGGKSSKDEKVNINDVYRNMAADLGPGGEKDLNELDSEGLGIVMGSIKSAGYKKKGFADSQLDYTPDELTLKEDGGKLAVVKKSDGKRLMYLSQVGVNKKANAGDRKTREAILENSKTPGKKSTNPQAEQLRNKYNY
jgi:hypothetical protein